MSNDEDLRKHYMSRLGIFTPKDVKWNERSNSFNEESFIENQTNEGIG